MNDRYNEGTEVQTMSVEGGTVALLNKSEIDMQVSTAHKYPRSIKRFRDESLQMVTLNESIAESCIYALPRDGKTIEGPSARFAEVVASAWGNCRAGARVVSDSGEFITAQGVFHDLERNVAITYEVQRRITNKAGKRFSADMIAVTGNAASSIALRNAILKGVPKAFWDDMYQAARQTVMGDFKTLANRRAAALKAFIGLGVTEAQVFAKLGISGVEDITLEHLLVLRGLITAIKDGDTTPEQAFSDVAPAEKPQSGKPGVPPSAPSAYSQEQFDANLPKWKQYVEAGKKTPDDIIKMVEAKNPLTDAQKAAIRALDKPAEGSAPAVTFVEVAAKLSAAQTADTLDEAADLIGSLESADERAELGDIYNTRREVLGG